MSTTIEQSNMSVTYTENNHLLIVSESDGTNLIVTHSAEPNISITPSTMISDYSIDNLIHNDTTINGWVSASGTGTFNGINNQGAYLGYNNITLIGTGLSITAPEFTGSLSGNATTATTAIKSEKTDKIKVEPDSSSADRSLLMMEDQSPDGGYESIISPTPQSIKYNPATQTLTGNKILANTIGTHLHVSAQVQPMGNLFPIGPSFDGSKFTFWTMNHWGNTTPAGWSGPSITMFGQFAMTGIPVPHKMTCRDIQVNLQPEKDGDYTICAYIYPPMETGAIMATNQDETCPRLFVSTITYSGQTPDNYSGVLPPAQLEVLWNSSQIIEKGSWIVISATHSIGRFFYMDVLIDGIRVD